jgi:hypothetical protein
MAVRDRGSTGCGNSLSSSGLSDRFEFDLSRLEGGFCVSARCSKVNREAIEARCRRDAALGRWSIPTLKSHRHSLQSSPTLPNR